MKIEFKYSHIYELRLNPSAKMMLSKRITTSITKMEDFWEKEGSRIEKTLTSITGLNFTRQTIPCYLNSSQSFSDPLTLQIEKVDDMYDNLAHELVHVILTQNSKKIDKKWKAFFGRFKDEVFTTRVHIAVHAIHLLLAKSIFPNRVSRIRSYSKFRAYVRSWEIVEKEGADNIVFQIFGAAK